MGLSCSCGDWDDAPWFWYAPNNYTALKTKRSRKCCSCGATINVGDTCAQFERFKSPDSDIEERIYGDEVPLAPYHMCETCADLYFSLDDLGLCITLGDSMRALVAEYAEMKAEQRQEKANG